MHRRDRPGPSLETEATFEEGSPAHARRPGGAAGVMRSLRARLRFPNSGFSGPLGDRFAPTAPTPAGVVVAREAKGSTFRAPLSLDTKGRVYSATKGPGGDVYRLRCFDREGAPVWSVPIQGTSREPVLVLPEGLVHHDQGFAKRPSLTFRSFDGEAVWVAEVSHSHVPVPHPDGRLLVTGAHAGASLLSPEEGEVAGQVAGIAHDDTLYRGLFDRQGRLITTRTIQKVSGRADSPRELVALDIDGSVAWRFERPFISMWPAACDRDGNLYSRHAKGVIAVSGSGRLLWEEQSPYALQGFGAATGPKGAVYWATDDTVEVRLPDGRRESLSLPGVAKGPPAFSGDGTVIFGTNDDDGTLFFASPDLKSHRTVPLGSAIESGVALDGQGRLSVGTDDGIVFLR